MLFGKRDKKKPNDRVLDLKARVDALRAADEASRGKPYTLEHFLEGDDVLTGRQVDDDYKPTGFDPAAPGQSSAPAVDDYEVDLQAELEKYLKRQEELVQGEDRKAVAQPQTPAPPEPADTSFLLDGTWSRDGAPPPPPANLEPLDSSRAWPGEDATWLSPSGLPGGNPSPSEHDEGSMSPWPDSSQWPPEEEWPPREDEAV